jgi:prepilin-type N-terminal cleavage/methylation domain-containing protein
MRQSASNSQRGFTLVEMLVAMLLGAIVIGAAVTMFKNGSDVTTLTTQRSQLQTDLRAAENLLIQDISMAGAGMPTGGVIVPNVVPAPRYGCDLTGVCYVTQTFPTLATVPVTPPRAYYVIPGPNRGPTITGQPTATDIVTVIYTDPNFLLNEYTAAFPVPANPANPAITQITFTPPAIPPVTPPQAVNDPVVGLKPGDVLLITSTKGAALAVVTSNVTAGAGSYTVQFVPGDVLRLNSTAATSPVQAMIIANGQQIQASRVFIITYYLDQIVDAGGNQTARLMRQVNTQAPVPLADNIVNMKFTYDSYDDNGVLQAELPDGGMGNATPISPTMIQRVNLAALTGRSPTAGIKGFQGLNLQTGISVRNISFKDRYK